MIYNITDTERLNYLQMITDRKNYTGRVILRESVTGRGWRLHETSKSEGSASVRQAIDKYMNANIEISKEGIKK